MSKNKHDYAISLLMFALQKAQLAALFAKDQRNFWQVEKTIWSMASHIEDAIDELADDETGTD